MDLLDVKKLVCAFLAVLHLIVFYRVALEAKAEYLFTVDFRYTKRRFYR